MVHRSPEANSGGNGQGAETAGHQEEGETVCKNLAGRSRVRIVISAQRNRVKATYGGQILVDMGGNEIQLYNGPVDCKTSC
jgi:hypothetical protein